MILLGEKMHARQQTQNNSKKINELWSKVQLRYNLPSKSYASRLAVDLDPKRSSDIAVADRHGTGFYKS
jgi:hypothetical protein